MSLDLKRWAMMAQEMQFRQLEGARKQAESWRAGLAALTALVGSVLIVKGRDSFADLAAPYRQLVMLLLGAALVALVTATMLAVRAAAGTPGEEITLSGQGLRDWSIAEVRRIATTVRRATWLTLTGLYMIALAVGLTWVGPIQTVKPMLVRVEHSHGEACGELAGADQGQLILTNSTKKQTTIVALATVSKIEKVSRCP
ncbi:hypothetical protein GCM10010402_68060 [Actinomadura luteofluorescens]|uniref:hypothetical protein n=1 Tax=Actinomadura luteofluorescens TaxID=46163 RepID=UPI0021645E9D|nr:hypothetical protein [Actinomadura glauciflava]MCR3740073.1 hypothetical protein [Actinomadura glauciflava]